MPGAPNANLATKSRSPQLTSGMNEEQMHRSAGTRNGLFSAVLPKYIAAGLGSATVTAASFPNFTFSVPITGRKGMLPWPQTPIVSYLRFAGNQQRSVQLRIRGFNQFGDFIEEITPTCTLVEPAFLVPATAVPLTPPLLLPESYPAGISSQAFIFCSKVFSQIVSVDASISGAQANFDVLAVDFGFPADRCRGIAVLWSAGTAGNFTLTITPPGGAGETTANIAVNAAAATVKSAIEALAQFATPGYTVEVSASTGIGAVGSQTNPWVIVFNGGAPRDQFDIVVNYGGAGTFTLTGYEYVGHDNLGFGCPYRIQAYRPGVSQTRYPEVFAMHAEVTAQGGVSGFLGGSTTTGQPDLGGYPPGAKITANTQANPTVVTLDRGFPYAVGQMVPVMIVGSNSNPVINGVWPATFVTANTCILPINVATGAGTAGFLIPIRTNSAQQIALAPAGTLTDPVASAGFKVGVNATDLRWQGDEHKIGIYLDSSRAAGAHTLTSASAFGAVPLKLIPFQDEALRLSCWVRTTRGGSGARDMSTRRYPK